MPEEMKSQSRIGPNMTALSEPIPLIVERAETKPGYQTSEFWQGIISHVAALCLIFHGIRSKESEFVMLGASLLGLTSSAYAISRGLAKKG